MRQANEGIIRDLTNDYVAAAMTEARVRKAKEEAQEKLDKLVVELSGASSQTAYCLRELELAIKGITK